MTLITAHNPPAAMPRQPRPTPLRRSSHSATVPTAGEHHDLPTKQPPSASHTHRPLRSTGIGNPPPLPTPLSATTPSAQHPVNSIHSTNSAHSTNSPPPRPDSAHPSSAPPQRAAHHQLGATPTHAAPQRDPSSSARHLPIATSVRPCTTSHRYSNSAATPLAPLQLGRTPPGHSDSSSHATPLAPLPAQPQAPPRPTVFSAARHEVAPPSAHPHAVSRTPPPTQAEHTDSATRHQAAATTDATHAVRSTRRFPGHTIPRSQRPAVSPLWHPASRPPPPSAETPPMPQPDSRTAVPSTLLASPLSIQFRQSTSDKWHTSHDAQRSSPTHRHPPPDRDTPHQCRSTRSAPLRLPPPPS
ncbi:hypothetical protein SAMN05216174_103163 [Actinokineospora iranica]|uniref:Uncharacterized protein n=1 Tax=Actinokineospora iranica TaxID=1271860 RepID=A0A1G6N386_9PSEU|nr:hypothetical protein SAMN05216174_103163 [Actinokineospora iranica]